MNDNSLQLQQQQGLKLRLNPRQVMFGRLLEMTAPQIDDEVRRALDENPALELAPAESTDNGTSDTDHFDETAEQLQRADYATDDDVPIGAIAPAGRQSQWADSDFEPVAADNAHSLIDSLADQLSEFDIDPEERRIALYIIGNLDDNGYLTRTVAAMADDIAIATGRDVTSDEVRRALRRVQALDPAGIGATDLRECLLLQIDRRIALNDPADDRAALRTAREILADWFDLFAKKHFDRIAARLDISHSRMQAALDAILRLNPKPGAQLASRGDAERLDYIVPDFSVEVDPDGVATVTLLSRTPELAIEQTFDIADTPDEPSLDSRSSARRREALAFIRRRRDDATAFIRLLQMRADTLMAVMQAIVTLQPEFFSTFRQDTIRPMILRDVAQLTGLNLSVISRATNSKYVLTPHGIFPLKMFFNERPRAEVDTSQHQYMEAIRSLIEHEDKAHPLSDDAITRTLRQQGYDLARRTVAKYRERLGLPVARLRKHF